MREETRGLSDAELEAVVGGKSGRVTWETKGQRVASPVARAVRSVASVATPKVGGSGCPGGICRPQTGGLFS